MNRKNKIEHLLKNNLKNWQIQILDKSHEHAGHNNFDGTQETHFKIIIKNNSIFDLSRIEIHKKINNILINEFKTGLHALEIQIIK